MNIIITTSAQEKDIFSMYEGDVDLLLVSQMEGRMERSKERIIKIAQKRAIDEGLSLPIGNVGIISYAFNRNWVRAGTSLQELEFEAGIYDA